MSKKNKKTKKNKIPGRISRIIISVLIIAFCVWYYLFDGYYIIEELKQNYEQTIEVDFTDGDYVEPPKEVVSKTDIALDKLEIPLCTATKNQMEKTGDHEVHSYNGFTLCYREDYEVAEWVAYTLTREELNKVTERSNKFKADPSISTGSAVPTDYTNSGYDRGHLAPAGDLVWSQESMEDSFYMSNMTPQLPDLNRGMWKKLEDQVRVWADTFGEVVVVTGPILEKQASEYNTIGGNQVVVPEYFYKVLLAQVDDAKIAMAFILPNQKCEGTIWDYTVSVDEVEKRTGLDFFSLLNDEEENGLESTISTDKWE